MKKIFLFVSVLAGIIMPSRCISENQRIGGEVIDAITGDPLPFAHVICGNVGVTTNLDGKFSLSFLIDSQPLLLIVKYMGYESKKLMVADPGETIKVEMNPASSILEEVFVLSADQIMSDLNHYRQINYEYQNMLLSSFYKESVYTEDNIAYLAEGVFDIYLPTIYSSDKIEIEIKKTRKKKFVDLDSSEMLFVSGHASDMINGSIRREHSFLDWKEMKNYTYTKEGLSYYDEEEVYIIKFEPSGKKGTASGLLYITTQSNALVRAEYYPVVDRQHFWKKVKWVEEYIEINSTWLLKQVIYEGSWSINSKQFAFEAILDVTTFCPISSKPKMTDTISDRAIFFDAADSMDHDFWNHHNYVELSEKELRAMPGNPK